MFGCEPLWNKAFWAFLGFFYRWWRFNHIGSGPLVFKAGTKLRITKSMKLTNAMRVSGTS